MGSNATTSSSNDTHSSNNDTPSSSNATPSSSNTTSNATPSSSSNATPNSSSVSTSKSYAAHMYGVGILTLLAVGLYVFYHSSDIKGEKKKDSTPTATASTNKTHC